MFAFSAEGFLSPPFCTDVHGSFCDPFISGEELPDVLLKFFFLPSPSGRTEPTLFSTIGPILGLAHIKFWQKRNRLRKQSDRLNASTFPEKNFRIVSFLEVSSLAFLLIFYFAVSKWTYGTSPVFDYWSDSRVGAYEVLAKTEPATKKLGPTECLNIFRRGISGLSLFLEVSSLDISPHIFAVNDVRNQPCF